MIVWRISNYAELTGLGGLLTSGRWRTAGHPVIYAAEHPALALLETLVHLERAAMPAHYQLLAVELPDREAVKIADDAPIEFEATRAVGDAWLAIRSSLALGVPSFVAPHSWNYLINPSHPAIARARILSAERWPFDPRLAA